MSDNFDKDLANRIKEVFETYEDASENRGWEKLRSHLPEPVKSRRAALRFGAAAAVLLLSAGIWLFTDFPKENEVTITGGKKNSPRALSKRSVEPEQQVPSRTSDNIDFKTEKQSSTTNRTDSKASGPLTGKRQIATAGTRNVSSKKHEAEETTTPPTRSYVEEKTANNLIQNPNSNTNGVPAVTRSPEIIGPATTISVPSTDLAHLSDADTTAKATNNIVKNEVSSVVESPASGRVATRKERAKSSLRSSWGIFAASYINYADGSEASFNTGVGVSSEVYVNKKLKFLTGLFVGQNSLKYSGLIPQTAASTFRDAVSYASASSNNIASNSVSIKAYHADLLALDIPLNLKYTISIKPRSIYIVGGLSSSYFLKEAYTYSFNSLISNAFSSGVADASRQDNTKDYHTFNFARTLNISFGFDYPISKQSRLSFEPFLKYPLGGMGENDLHFGAAGMNLKLNFLYK